MIDGRFAAVCARIERAAMHLARRRILTCVLIGLCAIGGRLAFIRIDPFPEPVFHDEFSYLLGGETLALGRMANPAHPMWRFFETYHVNMTPTYVSKYPPAQATFLALGIRLFGHPWYGVLLSAGLLCGCLCWMLQGWLPPKYALVGGVFALLQFGLTHYWIDSYWGGAVAGTGGALVMGALPRLVRRPTFGAASAAAFGTVVLANSRPWEGLVLVVLASAALIWWTRGRLRFLLRPAVALPMLVLLVAGAAVMARYNLETTGNALVMPYSVNQDRYATTPVLWVLPPYAPKVHEYRDAPMRAFWEEMDAQFYWGLRRNPALVIDRLANGLGGLLGSPQGMELAFFGLCALMLIRVRRLRIVLWVLGLFLAVICLSKFDFAHYLAPGLGAFFVVAMFGLRFLRCQRFGNRPVGLPLCGTLICGFVVVAVLFNIESAVWQRQALRVPTVLQERRLVRSKLDGEPGQHLVLVHYGPEHDPNLEVVYNGADIDSQKIVWACDFGDEADRPLLSYYSGRRVWRLEADDPEPHLTAVSR